MRTFLATIACLSALLPLLAPAADNGDMPPEIAKTLAAAAKNQDDSDARERLADQSSKSPETFDSIILSDADPTERWMAVYAIRKAGHEKCDKALASVFNNPKELQDLRIQVMMCLVEAPELTKDRLRPFLPGLHLLITERPRGSDLEHAVELVGYLGDKSSRLLLIPLLDDREVHSYTVESNGQQIPNSISNTAHLALQNISGRTDIPADRSAWEALK